MKTVSQVTNLTGISARTLQYYDEIGLLKPSKLTKSNYRLYDDEALQQLQQILFFKELDFSLKEINEILQKSDFDRIAAFKKQKELLLLKRNRTDRLIHLLSRLEKGDNIMSFKEFDLSDYIQALECFKNSNTDDVIKYWKNIENFNLFVKKIKDNEPVVAKLAIKQSGSIEKYIEEVKYNLEHFEEIKYNLEHSSDTIGIEDTERILHQRDNLYKKLTYNLSIDYYSNEIQQIVQEIESFINDNFPKILLGKSYWNKIVEVYSSDDYVRDFTDTKYGKGASDYIAKVFQYYANNHYGKNT